MRLTKWLLGLAVFVVGVEFGCRWLWTPPPQFASLRPPGLWIPTADGDIALQPGFRGAEPGDPPTPLALDSLGLRGDELPPKRAGERRLLLLGDALVWGRGVAADDALPARLQGELAAIGAVLTVGNAGVPDYGSVHVVKQQARLDDAFGADLFVVGGNLGDDAIDDLGPERTVYADLLLRGPHARLAETSVRARLAYRSRAALWVESWLLSHRPQWSLLASVPSELRAVDPLAGLPIGRTFAGLFQDAMDENVTWSPVAPPPLPRLLATLRRSLQALQARAGPRPLLFVLLPTRWQVDEQARQDELRRHGFLPVDFPRGTVQGRWLAIAAELGIAAVDATPVLAAEPSAGALFLADGLHYSRRGHELLARWLAGPVAALSRP